jgi:hypothetical protein
MHRHNNAHRLHHGRPTRNVQASAHTFEGKTDKDLQHCHVNITTTQKWVNLMLIILNDFKGKGHCVKMDSAYMGDIMVQIGHEE